MATSYEIRKKSLLIDFIKGNEIQYKILFITMYTVDNFKKIFIFTAFQVKILCEKFKTESSGLSLAKAFPRCIVLLFFFKSHVTHQVANLSID